MYTMNTSSIKELMNGTWYEHICDFNCSAILKPKYGIFMKNPGDMLMPWTHNSHFVFILSLHLVAFIFGLVGNGIVVLVMVGDRKTRNATNLFLVSLALADLLFLLVYAPLQTLSYFILQWDEAGTICKMAKYAELLSAVVSVLNLAAVTLERFLVIVFPIKSRPYCTISNCRRAILVVWLASLVLTSPVLVTYETYPIVYTNFVTNVTLHYCNETVESALFAVYQFIILFGVPGALMIVCYTFVIRELWRSTHNMRVLTNSVSMKNVKPYSLHPPLSHCRSQSSVHASSNYKNDQHNECPQMNESCSNRQEQVYYDRFNKVKKEATMNLVTKSFTNNIIILPTNKQARHLIKADDVWKARKQVIKMLILVIILFLVCWGPRIIMEIFIKVGLKSFSSAMYWLRIIFYALPVAHACMNPIIYSFMSKNFRHSLQRQFQRMGCNTSAKSSNVHETRFGSSRFSRIRRDILPPQSVYSNGMRQKSCLGSTSSSTNCNTETNNILVAADV